MLCGYTTHLPAGNGCAGLPEEPNGAIVDTVHVKAAGDGRWVSTARCTGAGGKPREYFVLYKKTDPSEAHYLHHVLRVWGVSAQGKLVEVPAKTVKCLNDDYGA